MRRFIRLYSLEIPHFSHKDEIPMPAEQSNLCDDIQPWLAAYALGDAENGAAERAHLAVCPRCQHDLREYQLVAGMLPYDAPGAAARPQLRHPLLAAVRQQPSQATPP